MESNLNEVLGIAFYAQEQEEEKSRQIEDLIKSYKGASALLPPRQYGKPLNPEKFGITLRSIIEYDYLLKKLLSECKKRQWPGISKNL